MCYFSYTTLLKSHDFLTKLACLVILNLKKAKQWNVRTNSLMSNNTRVSYIPPNFQVHCRQYYCFFPIVGMAEPATKHPNVESETPPLLFHYSVLHMARLFDMQDAINLSLLEEGRISYPPINLLTKKNYTNKSCNQLALYLLNFFLYTPHFKVIS